jgi:hypothetical protein
MTMRTSRARAPPWETFLILFSFVFVRNVVNEVPVDVLIHCFPPEVPEVDEAGGAKFPS